MFNIFQGGVPVRSGPQLHGVLDQVVPRHPGQPHHHPDQGVILHRDLMDDELVDDLFDDPPHDHDLLHRRRPLQATLTST